jgi:integrase
MRDGSLVKLQAILGHASIRTTQVYAHLVPITSAVRRRSSKGLETEAVKTEAGAERVV